MNSLLLSMRVRPSCNYGDEIGMGDNVFIGDRNGVRTPMQWSPDRNAGFSRADPQRLYLPPIMDPIYGYQATNVEAQLRDPSSLLSWTKRLLAVRKTSQAFVAERAASSGPGIARSWPTCANTAMIRSCASANLSRTSAAGGTIWLPFKGRFRRMLADQRRPPIGDLP